MRVNGELGISLSLFADLMRSEGMFGKDQGKKFSSGHLKDYYMEMLHETPIYRLSINKNARVTTACFDLIENFAPELDEVYDSVQDLPRWVQERLAVLMVLDPTQVNEEVEGVGRRISKHVFWIFGEANGANTGEES